MSRDVYQVLTELVAWTAEPDTRVLTVYLDLTDPVATTSFLRDNAALLEAYELDAVALASRVDRGDGGLCLVRCFDPALSVDIELRFPFDNQALVGRDPFLRQLLYYAEEYERSVLVRILGEDEAQLVDLHIGAPQRSRTVRPTHGRSLGGELAIHLARRVKDTPGIHIVLGGPDDLRDAVEAELPERVGTAVIGRLGDVGDDALLPAVHRALQDHERRIEALGIALLVEEAERGGPVVVGLADTLAAINAGTMETLYVLQGFAVRGWLCDACDTLGVLPKPPACTVCGASTSVVPLQEHVLDQAAACGAELETVFESADLQRMGGIGAVLPSS